MAKQDALATTEGADYPLAVLDGGGADIMAALADELGDDAASLGMSLFSRVKIPSGGGVAFEIENADDPDDPEVAKTIEGVIVAHHSVNTYWATPMGEGENSAPDCYSRDGKTGTGVRFASDGEGGAHDCGTCPLNEFGSDAGGGKACKNGKVIFILRSDDIVPLMLTLPPASIKPFTTYLAKSVVMKRRRAYGVVTRIGLEKAKSGGGIEYSRATFALAGVLDADTTEAMRQYGDGLASVVASDTAPIQAKPADAAPSVISGDDMPF